MKHQLVIVRLIFGLLFIFSGFVKIIDPVGTGLVIQEYLNVVHLDFLSFARVVIGVALSLLEFMVGVAILMRMRMRVAASIGLWMTVFFTITTLLLLIFDPIQDCGCFGEAASLTHGETFFKNLVLLGCIIPIYIKRNNFRRASSVFAEWMFISIYGVIVLSLSIVSYVRMPVIEFTDFKMGADIASQMVDTVDNGDFNTVFVYEKDGERREFSIDELPDTTWTYVESVDMSMERGDLPFEFHVTNAHGEYITDTLITVDKPLVICSIYDIDRFYTPKRWMAVNMLKERVESQGGELWLLVATTPEHLQEVLGADVMERFEVGYTDYKTAIAVQRSNGGYLYINNAFIVKKWSRQGLQADADLSVISQDFDKVMIRDIIKQQLIYEISIVVLFLSIIAIRYLCKVVAIRRLKSL